MNTTAQTKRNAAAELYKHALDRMGVIDTTWRKDDTNVVCATTHGGGPHLMNQARDYDTDVHLICETGKVRDAGNLPGGIDVGEHGPIFFNVKVHDVADDPTGYGLPTHSPGATDASVKSDLSDELRELARVAGVDLSGE